MPKKMCKGCSVITKTDKDFCPTCGASYLTASEQEAGSPDGAGFATAGLVSGAISFLFLPIVFGVLGIIFGSIAWSKGNPRGQAATIISIVGLILGLIISIAVW